ncbi:hypothetical protein V5799_030854 [Amblyomma americanum]|uniref:Cuticle protein n=1 Tax=Amblyomma americanum TaxID=6943 RepID=A0AAQ4ELW7_AMBAM
MFPKPPQPYSFGYDNVDEYGNRQFRSEQGDSSNAKTGSYGYRDAYGLYRRVNYVADANGFRATVDTNEPGTALGASANAVFNAAPVVPPVPGNAAASRAGFAPTAYGANGVATGYNNAYGGYTGYGYGPYSGGAAGYGRIPYAGNGYTPNGAAVGGYAYGAGAGAYAGGYGSFVYGGANGWAPGYGGYTRR